MSSGNNIKERVTPQRSRIVPLSGILCFEGLPHLHRKADSEDGSLFVKIATDVNM